MSFKIALAGDLGSGKSTVSRLLIEKTGAVYYSTGAICRSIAARYGMSIDDFNVYMETHPEVDHEIDDTLCALSEHEEDTIIDSRMAFHFVKDTFAVYLTTDPLVSAQRILNDHRAEETFQSLEEAVARVKARRESEKKRYFDQYRVQIKDMGNYTLILDTTYISPEKCAEVILSSLAAYQAGDTERRTYLSPDRLYADRSALRLELVAGLARSLDMGDTLPRPRVTEQDGIYTLLDGAEIALAHRIAGVPLVECELVPGVPPAAGNYEPLTDFPGKDGM